MNRTVKKLDCKDNECLVRHISCEVYTLFGFLLMFGEGCSVHQHLTSIYELEHEADNVSKDMFLLLFQVFLILQAPPKILFEGFKFCTEKDWNVPKDPQKCSEKEFSLSEI